MVSLNGFGSSPESDSVITNFKNYVTVQGFIILFLQKCSQIFHALNKTLQ